VTFYDVITLPRAERDIEAAYGWMMNHAPSVADAWYDDVFAAIDSLGEMPQRCPLAPEAKYFKQEVRHLILGAYRILFTVDERNVRVMTIRHVSRKPLKRPPSR